MVNANENSPIFTPIVFFSAGINIYVGLRNGNSVVESTFCGRVPTNAKKFSTLCQSMLLYVNSVGCVVCGKILSKELMMLGLCYLML